MSLGCSDTGSSSAKARTAGLACLSLLITGNLKMQFKVSNSNLKAMTIHQRLFPSKGACHVLYGDWTRAVLLTFHIVKNRSVQPNSQCLMRQSFSTKLCCVRKIGEFRESPAQVVPLLTPYGPLSRSMKGKGNSSDSFEPELDSRGILRSIDRPWRSAVLVHNLIDPCNWLSRMDHQHRTFSTGKRSGAEKRKNNCRIRLRSPLG